MTWKPLHIFAMALAGWMNREQQDVIAYLREENRILREKLGHKRIILNEPQNPQQMVFDEMGRLRERVTALRERLQGLP
jgi:polyhydroxyalkanoate synthesis regulator phasin